MPDSDVKVNSQTDFSVSIFAFGHSQLGNFAPLYNNFLQLIHGPVRTMVRLNQARIGYSQPKPVRTNQNQTKPWLGQGQSPSIGAWFYQHVSQVKKAERSLSQAPSCLRVIVAFTVRPHNTKKNRSLLCAANLNTARWNEVLIASLFFLASR